VWDGDARDRSRINLATQRRRNDDHLKAKTKAGKQLPLEQFVQHVGVIEEEKRRAKLRVAVRKTSRKQQRNNPMKGVRQVSTNCESMLSPARRLGVGASTDSVDTDGERAALPARSRTTIVDHIARPSS